MKHTNNISSFYLVEHYHVQTRQKAEGSIWTSHGKEMHHFCGWHEYAGKGGVWCSTSNRVTSSIFWSWKLVKSTKINSIYWSFDACLAIKTACLCSRYDLKDTSKITLMDIQLISAMGPPGGGRNAVTPRFLRHFNICSINSFSDETMVRIFSNVVAFYLRTNDFPPDCFTLGNQIVTATLDVSCVFHKVNICFLVCFTTQISLMFSVCLSWCEIGL